jgi:hypothetical protein
MAEAENYDVFFSYAWATATEDPTLRDWCRYVADTISILLSQQFNAKPPRFSRYLDRDAARAGQDLSVLLKGAVERSSVFVVLVSDYYDSPYCLDEASWFAQRMTDAGLDMANHLCILRVQPSSREWWPPQLTGKDGKPLLYLDFCDPNGRPFGMTNFLMKGPTPELAGPIEKAALEIGQKLATIRNNQNAKEAYRNAQRPPDDPVVFFEAETGDLARWSDCLPHLRDDVPSIVLPAGPLPATAADCAAFTDCNGLVMLRSRGTDDIGSRIKRAYQLRRQLSKQGANDANLTRDAGGAALPWVLLDEQDSPPPECESFRVPRVRVQPGWAAQVKEKLWG